MPKVIKRGAATEPPPSRRPAPGPKKRIIEREVVGATKEGHIAAAVAAMDLGLTEDEVARLEAPYLPKSPVGVETTVPRNWSLSVADT